MCGLSGYIGGKRLPEKIIAKTLVEMKNRGPDHQGYKLIRSGKNNIYLLSSRLKIVDRNPRSNQPMRDENLTIVYNGEIYNIDKIRSKILENGIKLKTQSDTELILKMYKIFGTNCVNYFEGMWAFALYDNQKKHLFVSRDRLGEKPLYIYRQPNEFFFASETKFIRSLLGNYKKLNDKKILKFLKFGYKSLEQEKESFFKNIFKVEPGTNYLLKNDFSLKKIRYWKPKINEQEQSIDECKDAIQTNFQQKIKLICDTDLKIGLSLSGGIDSNYVLGYITKFLNKKINTYSIIDKNSKKYDEENLIDLVVSKNNIKNCKIYLTNKTKNLSNLRKLINYHDKPISTISLYIQSLIYKKMKDDGVKVCVTGNGADELFAGYYHHYNLYYNSIKNKVFKATFKKEWEKNILPLIRNKEYKSLKRKNLKSYFSLIDEKYLNFKKIEMYKEKYFLKNLLRNKLINELLYQTIPLALTEDDLNSMYYSIENRSPFLNRDLVETSFKFPTKYLMKNSFNKYLLRESSKNIIPERIRLNREKKGFNASFSSIFSFNDKSFREWFFDKDSKNPIYNYLNKKYFLTNFKKDSKNLFEDSSTQTLFNICSTKLFLEEINS
ncbi:MAG: asparagine synthase (glutamine-hydrolyzing) [Candidatus Pelagibacter sp.]|nr:asparagine synthase (glutamine-hydrolyzing) [Candidatus Pelagibacter sp.]